MGTKYRWFISAKRGSNSYVQIAQFHLWDSNKNRIDLSSSTCTGSYGNGNAFSYANGSVSTLLTGPGFCAYWNNSGLNIIFDCDYSDVKYYSYFTRADEPNRDPVSWTFSRSTDDGATWFVLDTRTNATIPTDRGVETALFEIGEYYWRMTDGEYPYQPKNPEIPEIYQLGMIPPYPPVFWQMRDGDYPYFPDNPEPIMAGAFCGCSNLKSVKIPYSVTYIGPYAFAGTGLRSVTINPDCEYSPTSFPEGCEITFYDRSQYLKSFDILEYVEMDRSNTTGFKTNLYLPEDDVAVYIENKHRMTAAKISNDISVMGCGSNSDTRLKAPNYYSNDVEVGLVTKDNSAFTVIRNKDVVFTLSFDPNTNTQTSTYEDVETGEVQTETWTKDHSYDREYPIGIGYIKSSSSGGTWHFTGRIYYVIVKYDGVEVMHIVPAQKKSTGEVGYYDLVNNTFDCIPNLTPGPIIT